MIKSFMFLFFKVLLDSPVVELLSKLKNDNIL